MLSSLRKTRKRSETSWCRKCWVIHCVGNAVAERALQLARPGALVLILAGEGVAFAPEFTRFDNLEERIEADSPIAPTGPSAEMAEIDSELF